jgi:16S rRNA (adenine1518-N6/adenine1519-N6)-dimethyltransferase
MAKKEWPPKWNHLILTVQKEVANRLLAKIGSREYGRLTILLNWRNNIELICNVKPSSFYPKPKVVSSIIKITPKKNNFPKTSFENLEKILRVAFSFRRKTIKNNLKLLNLDPDEILKKSNIQSSLRPQNLSIEDFCNLANLCETALL